MARKDRRELVKESAYRELGKQNYRWIVGWDTAKAVAPFVIAALIVGVPGWFVWRTIDGVSAAGASFAPVSAGPWPWLLLAVSALVGAALIAYRWANPFRGGPALIVGAVLCFMLSALAVLWASAAY